MLVMGDLNVNIEFPCDKQEEVIVDLLNEANLVDTSCGYRLRTLRRTATRAQWSWSKKGGQLDTTCSRTTSLHARRKRSFLRALGSASHGSSTWITVPLSQSSERCKRQKFSPSLPPGPKDADATAFDALAP
jgi:hypothetical protein